MLAGRRRVDVDVAAHDALVDVRDVRVRDEVLGGRDAALQVDRADPVGEEGLLAHLETRRDGVHAALDGRGVHREPRVGARLELDERLVVARLDGAHRLVGGQVHHAALRERLVEVLLGHPAPRAARTRLLGAGGLGHEERRLRGREEPSLREDVLDAALEDPRRAVVAHLAAERLRLLVEDEHLAERAVADALDAVRRRGVERERDVGGRREDDHPADHVVREERVLGERDLAGDGGEGRRRRRTRLLDDLLDDLLNNLLDDLDLRLGRAGGQPGALLSRARDAFGAGAGERERGGGLLADEGEHLLGDLGVLLHKVKVHGADGVELEVVLVRPRVLGQVHLEVRLVGVRVHEVPGDVRARDVRARDELQERREPGVAAEGGADERARRQHLPEVRGEHRVRRHLEDDGHVGGHGRVLLGLPRLGERRGELHAVADVHPPVLLVERPVVPGARDRGVERDARVLPVHPDPRDLLEELLADLLDHRRVVARRDVQLHERDVPLGGALERGLEARAPGDGAVLLGVRGGDRDVGEPPDELLRLLHRAAERSHRPLARTLVHEHGACPQQQHRLLARDRAGGVGGGHLAHRVPADERGRQPREERAQQVPEGELDEPDGEHRHRRAREGLLPVGGRLCGTQPHPEQRRVSVRLQHGVALVERLAERRERAVELPRHLGVLRALPAKDDADLRRVLLGRRAVDEARGALRRLEDGLVRGERHRGELARLRRELRLAARDERRTRLEVGAVPRLEPRRLREVPARQLRPRSREALRAAHLRGRQRDDERVRARRLRGLGRLRLLEDEVAVGAAEPERVDAHVELLDVGDGLDLLLDLALDLGVERADADRRHQRAVLHHEDRLDHAAHARRRLHVPEVALDRPGRERHRAVRRLREHLVDRVRLQRVAHRRPGAVRLDVPHRGGVDAAARRDRVAQLGLRLGRGRGEREPGLAVVAGLRPDDDGVDAVAVAHGVLVELQHRRAGALGAHVPVGVLVERPALARRRVHVRLLDGDEEVGLREEVGAPRDGEARAPELEHVARVVHRGERARARRVDGDRRPAEAVAVRHAVRDHARDDGRRGEPRHVVRVRHRLRQVLAEPAPDHHRRGRVDEVAGLVPRVLERLPRALEQVELLRVQLRRLEGRHLEELRVEPAHVVGEPGLDLEVAPRDAALGLGLADRALALHEELPVRVEVLAPGGEEDPETDDSHLLGLRERRRRRCRARRARPVRGVADVQLAGDAPVPAAELLLERDRHGRAGLRADPVLGERDRAVADNLDGLELPRTQVHRDREGLVLFLVVNRLERLELSPLEAALGDVGAQLALLRNIQTILDTRRVDRGCRLDLDVVWSDGDLGTLFGG